MRAGHVSSQFERTGPPASLSSVDRPHSHVMQKTITRFLGPLLLAVVICSAISGCTGTTAKLNHVRLGMTRTEVIQAIGSPDSISAKGDIEYLGYLWGSSKE